jgi:hypothetical protein
MFTYTYLSVSAVGDLILNRNSVACNISVARNCLLHVTFNGSRFGIGGRTGKVLFNVGDKKTKLLLSLAKPPPDFVSALQVSSSDAIRTDAREYESLQRRAALCYS